MMRVDKDTEIDIRKCPHILVGGSTGSGKSYLMKNMLCDALLSDEDTKYIVIDPKSVDYQFLVNRRDLSSIGRMGDTLPIKMLWRERGISLMDRDSIDSLEVLRYLRSLVKDMYDRYRFMKKYGYVDWQEYLDDRKLEEDSPFWDRDEDEDNVYGMVVYKDYIESRNKCSMHYNGGRDRKSRYGMDREWKEYGGVFGDDRIVVMVDELSDLIYWDREKTKEILSGDEDGEDEESPIWMRMDDREWKSIKGGIEGCLIKLSILGRASGIHLILGTQRPDASILSGQLRANISCRICLRVSSDMERRIVLGQSIDKSMRKCERYMIYCSEPFQLKRELR